MQALVVEDDRAWQQILTEILEDMGLHVDVASTYEEAERAIRATPHRVAVVDLSLRFLDAHDQAGLRVLDALRRHDPTCVPILLTGYATVEVAVEALTERGAFTILRKETFRRREFQKLVRKALARPPAQDVPPIPAPPTEKAQTSGRPPTRGQALIVEDDAGWQAILAEILQDAGLSPRVCAGFGEALGCLRRERYVLAVVDLALGGGPYDDQNRDGYRLLALTRSAQIPTIVVSGLATADEVATAYEDQGVFAFVEKQTFSRARFLALVEEALQAREQPTEWSLTPREQEVLHLLAQGLTNKAIAERLVISPNTVKRHLQAIFGKLGVNTRAAAVAKWLSLHEEQGGES